MSELRLKPCPFCGNAAAVDEEPDRLTVFCDNSACAGHNINSSAAQWNTRAPASDDARRLESVIRTQLADVTERISKGKGTWPQNDYVRDETWAMWRGEMYALRSVLRSAGLNPDAAMPPKESEAGK